MNEASRMGITAHITRWINNIQQYDNVPMDLTVYNLVLEAESNLRNVCNKFKRLTEAWWQRVTRDMKQARMTQAQFDAEVDNQIQVEVDVEYALVIVRRKRKEYKILVAAEERRRQLEEDLARMRDQIAHQQATQQAKEKAEEEQNWQRSLSAKIDAHQKVITREALGSQCVSRSVQESMSHNSLIEDSSFSNRTFIA
jgi:hypothetical protein